MLRLLQQSSSVVSETTHGAIENAPCEPFYNDDALVYWTYSNL